jgi:hypothetical protein
MPESSEFIEPMPASHSLTNMVGTIMPNNSHMMPYSESDTYNPFNSNNEQAGGRRRSHKRRATKKRSSSKRRAISKSSATQKRRI